MKTSTVKLGLGYLLGAFIIGSATAIPAVADPSDASHEGRQPRVTPIGTEAPGAASHIALVDPEAITTRSVKDRLSVAADTVYALGRDHGFAGQVVDAENRSITIYWKGTPPGSIDDYRRYASSLGLTLDVRESADITRDEALMAAERITASEELVKAAGITAVLYGRTQLQAVAARVADTSEAEAAGVGSIAVKSDGSGLRVDLVSGLPPDATRAALVAATGLPTSAVEFVPDTGEIVPLPARIRPA